MQDDFYSSRYRPSRDDDDPDILRVNNCSEVDVAGNFYEHDDGKWYDVCCDSENEDAPECAENWLDYPGVWVGFIVVGLLVIFCIIGCYYDFVNFRWIYWYRKIHHVKTYGTDRSNISTISADLRQPPRPIVSKTPIAPATSVI